MWRQHGPQPSFFTDRSLDMKRWIGHLFLLAYLFSGQD